MTQKLILTVLMFASGLGLSQNTIEALKTRAESGDIAAQLELANAYEFGKGVAADAFAAFDWYLRAAETGNAEAQNVVAIKLRTGDGGHKDLEQAVKWYQKAAKQGSAEAMFNLGTCYYNGDGVPVDDQKALAWFIAAQAFGSKEAEEAVQRSLSETKSIVQASGILKGALMLANGVDVPQRSGVAVEWLKKLSDAGRKSATVYLAQIYLEGKGVPKNPELAVKYCEDGAKARLPQAMGCLGYMYRNGFGKPLDAGMAAKWYSKAAKCGEPASMFILSEMYEKGEGVKPDPVQQFALLNAASRYLPEAHEKLKVLSQQMSAKQIETALIKEVETDHCNQDAAMR